MNSRSDDIEAAARPLMSGSTTTTTLASNTSTNHREVVVEKLTTTTNRGSVGGSSNNNLIKLNNLKALNRNSTGDERMIDGGRFSKTTANTTPKTTTGAASLLGATNENNIEYADDNNCNMSRKVSRIPQAGVSGDDNDDSDDVDIDIKDGLQVTRKESNLIVGLKLFAIFSTIYFFMWSSSILSQAFNLASYHYAGHFIRTSGFLQNPLIGLMVGVITTVVFQSSGAVTSVLVTIVGSGVLNVRQSIPIVMGANLGTSVTNTVVSLVVYRKKQNFEIAMTAGIVHDMYNMMSVVFLLPIELIFHPLEYSSSWLLGLLGTSGQGGSDLGEFQFLSYLVRPLVDLFIIIDTDKTANMDPNVIVPSDVSLIKRCCNEERRGNEIICHQRCRSLFSYLELSDNVVCILLLVIAMFTLFTALIFVVKVTKSLLGGKLLNWVANLAGREYIFPYSMFVGYLFILTGLVITVILHSSGVFTSMLVPLAGGDVLNLMQIYELTLGSNVGTTTTGILAALSAQSKYPRETLQVALCHFLFNVAGILMFYTFPHTTLPIWASKKFGMYSAQNLWFSIAYLVIVFLVAPTITMAIYLMTTT